MVIALDRPDFDDLKLIESVVAERQKGKNAPYFNRIQNEWKIRIQDYINCEGNPERLQIWAHLIEHKEKFHQLYKNPKKGSSHEKMLVALRSKKLQLCPACGESGTPNTLDHFLPKSSFPEFSITTVNLFPMCDACQTKKGTKILDNNNQRLFIHPYFDKFTQEQIIFLEIGTPFASPEKIVLAPSITLDPINSCLLERHLAELEINQRYSHFFQRQYIRLLKLADSIRKNKMNMLDFLQCSQQMNAKEVNSWEHVFYTSVLSNKELLAYLENTELPDYI